MLCNFGVCFVLCFILCFRCCYVQVCVISMLALMLGRMRGIYSPEPLFYFVLFLLCFVFSLNGEYRTNKTGTLTNKEFSSYIKELAGIPDKVRE
jgi:hypothetical protein